MRALTLKLAMALFAVALVSACSSTSTTSDGKTDSDGVNASPVNQGGANGKPMGAGGRVMSTGNVI